MPALIVPVGRLKRPQNSKATKKPDIALVQLKTINPRLYLNSLSYVLELLKKQIKKS